MLQVAEGAVVEISNMLSRMRELAIQAASGTYSATDRAALNLELQQLFLEIQRIAVNTEWNGISILNGSDDNTNNPVSDSTVTKTSVTLQIGAGSGQSMTVDLKSWDPRSTFNTQNTVAAMTGANAGNAISGGTDASAYGAASLVYDAYNNPINDAEKRKKNLEEGRGFRLSTAMKKSGSFDFASSNPMWRASLNVLDFIPLVNADYGGGIIITDWFSENTQDDSIKITIMFSSNEIRADGLDVIIHQKKCLKDVCKTSLMESSLNNEIKLAILKKAAILKTSDLKKMIKKDGEYPVKRNN